MRDVKDNLSDASVTVRTIGGQIGCQPQRLKSETQLGPQYIVVPAFVMPIYWVSRVGFEPTTHGLKVLLQAFNRC